MQSTSYERLGGADKVRELVDRFYDLMDRRPEAQSIRNLHPADLRDSRNRLFLFLCGWLGGPELYTERYGHPRLRARHLPFPIGLRERDQWLFCMYSAMEELGIEENLDRQLRRSFLMTADNMRNR